MTERAGPRAFVCGHPVAHSRSPLIHGYWLAEHGIEGSYERVDSPHADFPSFISRLAELGYVGGNVTIPHKEAALAACDLAEPIAREIGAANTVWVKEGRLRGDNTDAYGFAANLDERAPGWISARSVVVLGAGGASRAVLYALRARGIPDIRIVNRTVARARELADRFGGGTTAHSWTALPELVSDATLVVNTTSVGMEGHDAQDALPWIADVADDAIVTDIVYVPLMTPLLAAASARGLRTVDGLGMLLHQAVPGFERWFGVRPTVTPALRSLIERDMAR